MRVVFQLSTALALAWISAPALAGSLDPDLATCAKKSGDEALAACTAAIKSGKWSGADLAITYYNRGIHNQKRQEYVLAIADYTEAIRINPQFVDAYENRAGVYRLQKDYARAIADSSEAIRVGPDSGGFYGRGLAYADQKDYARAIADYSEAIRLYPQGAITYLRRGEAKKALGKQAEGDADIARALAIDPHIAKKF